MKRPLLVLALLWIALIPAGRAMGLSLRTISPAERQLTLYEPREADVSGILGSVTETAAGSFSLRLDEASAHFPEDDGTYKIGSLLVYLPEEPEAALGSLLTVSGELGLQEPADNPGEFDAQAYYAAQGMPCFMNGRRIISEVPGKDGLSEAMRKLRKRLERGIALTAEPEDEGILRALLLGERNALDDETYGIYEAAGVSHIFSVSGMHVALAAALMSAAFGRLLLLIPWELMKGFWGRRGFLLLRSFLTAIGVAGYMLLTGGGLTVRRAALMFLLQLGGAVLGRSADLLTSLSLAALTVLIPHPMAFFQSNFQLSFGCVLVLGTVYPCLCRKLRLESPEAKTILLPVLLNLFMMPVILRHYGVFHPYSFLISCLVLPWLSFLIPAGFLSAFLAEIWLPAAYVVQGPVHAGLLLLRKACMLMNKLPGHTIITGKPGNAATIAYLAIAAGGTGLLILRQKKAEEDLMRELNRAGRGPVRKMLRESLAALPALLLITYVAAAVFLLPKAEMLRIASLYVGQGDCHVISDGRGRAFLIDGGSSMGSPAESVIEPYFRYQGIRQLTGIIVSHPDRDHVSGLAELMRMDGLSIGWLMLSAADRDTPGAAALAAAAHEEGIPVLYAAAGDAWVQDGQRFTVLYPTAETAYDGNDSSLVLRLDCGSFSALFTGDLSADREKAMCLVCTEMLDADYLKVPHHGSGTSCSAALLQAVSPETAVIPCGRNNTYGHPHSDTLKRLRDAGCSVYRTDLDGAVSLILAEDGTVRIEYFHEK